MKIQSEKKMRLDSFSLGRKFIENKTYKMSFNASNQKSTIHPPNWDLRKKIVKQRQPLFKKKSSMVAAKNIEMRLDNFQAHLNNYWKSGNMKSRIIKDNPRVKPTYIIEPKDIKMFATPQVKEKSIR